MRMVKMPDASEGRELGRRTGRGGLGGRGFEIDGYVGNALQLAAEGEPEVGAYSLHEALMSGAPARQALLQGLYASLCEVYEALTALRTLGYGKQALLLQLGQRPCKCR